MMMMKKNDMKHALAVKATLRSKAPRFTRQDAHKKKRLGWAWRKAKGLQSKVRLRLKHHKRVVKTGYGTPSLVKNANAKGMFPVVVCNETDVSKLTASQGAIISAGTSIRTKMALIDACAKAGTPVLNLSMEKFKAKFEKFMHSKKEKKEKSSSTANVEKKTKHDKKDNAHDTTHHSHTTDDSNAGKNESEKENRKGE